MSTLNQYQYVSRKMSEWDNTNPGPQRHRDYENSEIEISPVMKGSGIDRIWLEAHDEFTEWQGQNSDAAALHIIMRTETHEDVRPQTHTIVLDLQEALKLQKALEEMIFQLSLIDANAQAHKVLQATYKKAQDEHTAHRRAARQQFDAEAEALYPDDGTPDRVTDPEGDEDTDDD